MSKSDQSAIVILFQICAVLVAIYFIVIAALTLAGILVTIGAIFGGGVSLYNYGLALSNNIKPEKPIV